MIVIALAPELRPAPVSVKFARLGWAAPKVVAPPARDRFVKIGNGLLIATVPALAMLREYVESLSSGTILDRVTAPAKTLMVEFPLAFKARSPVYVALPEKTNAPIGGVSGVDAPRPLMVTFSNIVKPAATRSVPPSRITVSPLTTPLTTVTTEEPSAFVFVTSMMPPLIRVWPVNELALVNSTVPRSSLVKPPAPLQIPVKRSTPPLISRNVTPASIALLSAHVLFTPYGLMNCARSVTMTGEPVMA